MKQPNNLTFIPTEVLLNEVFNRIDCGIFCSTQEHEKNYTKRLFKGNFSTCIGLCELTKDMIIGEFEKENLPE